VAHYTYKEVATMATNLALDDALIEAGRQIGQHATKKAAVTAALEEYIQRRKQLEIFDLFGTIDYYEDYDYKKNRLLDKVEVEA
jgi:hypothetical protein